MKSVMYLSFSLLLVLAVILAGCNVTSGAENSDTSQVFYVDSSSGKDSNNGLSSSNAWKSVAKINTAALQPGDKILFRRGQVFEGGISITHSGTEAKPIVFDAYGTGANPILLGSRKLTNWTSSTGSIYLHTVTFEPGLTGVGIVLEDGVPLVFKAWKTDADTSLGSDAGVFTYDSGNLSTGTIYLRCSDSSKPSTHTIEAGYELFGVTAKEISNIQINNMYFKNYSCHGVTIRNCNNVTIRNCVAENIGGALPAGNPANLHGGNGFDFRLGSSNCGIYNSRAINVFGSGFSQQVSESGSVAKNIFFENCVAEKCGFAGIEISVISDNGSTGAKLENTQISKCTVKNSGTGWSRNRYALEGHGIYIKADTQKNAGAITDLAIKQSEISGCEGDGIYIEGETGTVTVSRSLIKDNKRNGIECEDNSGALTLKLQLSSSLIIDNKYNATTTGVKFNVADGNGFELINNTFCNNTVGLYVDNCGGTAILKNNLFYSADPAHAHLYAAKDLGSVISDYNDFYQNGGAVIDWASSSFATVSAFSATTKLDTHSIGAAPSFVSPSNFHLSQSSPCRNAGTVAGVILDYDGKPFGTTTPSIGAFQ